MEEQTHRQWLKQQQQQQQQFPIDKFVNPDES